MKRKPKFFYCNTWKMNYFYFIGWKQKSYEKYLKEEFNYETNLDNYEGICLVLENTRFQGIHLWVRDKKNIASFVHECIHAACSTLFMRQWKADLENEEPLAYLTEVIFKNSGI